MYDLLILGHIFASATLVGGTLLLQVLALRASSPSAPRGEMLALARQAGWVGPRVFLPASAIILGTGVGLASEMQYGLDRVARYLRVEVPAGDALMSHVKGHVERTPAAVVFSRFLRHLAYLEVPDSTEPLAELHWFPATGAVR